LSRVPFIQLQKYSGAVAAPMRKSFHRLVLENGKIESVISLIAG